MEEIFKKLDLEKQGINIDGEWLTDLRFADDVALTTTSVKDMETQLNGLNSESKKIGLKYTKGKQKCRWRDDITSYIGTTWARIAQDRGQWKLHEEGYIRHGLT
ncbi:uncharacterized protein [Amphiura filiformis]|uniref:uncharacterized protein n=1 Tax=Amphiura filiformis TaxID=82378 RepID=UPI003B2244AF